MWPIAYFFAWILKLCGFSAPYKRFAGIKRRPRQDGEGWTDSDTKALGHLMATLAFLVGIVVCFNSKDISKSLFWLILMSIAVIGMRVGGRSVRNELDEWQQQNSKEQSEKSYEQEILKACRLRRERRAAVRANEIVDDGLSEFGRSLAENPELAERIQNDHEKFNATFPSENENIFDFEEADEKVEMAWKRKITADTAWRKTVAEWGNL
jgi:hypothetical protein